MKKKERKIKVIPNFWKTIANDPDTLERTWNTLRDIMKKGALDPLTKEMIYISHLDKTNINTLHLNTIICPSKIDKVRQYLIFLTQLFHICAGRPDIRWETLQLSQTIRPSRTAVTWSLPRYPI